MNRLISEKRPGFLRRFGDDARADHDVGTRKGETAMTPTRPAILVGVRLKWGTRSSFFRRQTPLYVETARHKKKLSTKVRSFPKPKVVVSCYTVILEHVIMVPRAAMGLGA